MAADYVVRPLYVMLEAFSPQLGARCLTFIDANRAAWRAIIIAGDDASATDDDD